MRIATGIISLAFAIVIAVMSTTALGVSTLSNSNFGTGESGFGLLLALLLLMGGALAFKKPIISGVFLLGEWLLILIMMPAYGSVTFVQVLFLLSSISFLFGIVTASEQIVKGRRLRKAKKAKEADDWKTMKS